MPESAKDADKTSRDGVNVDDVLNLGYAAGRVMLAFGVLACAVGVVAHPIESYVSGQGLIMASSLAMGAGGQITGWGAVLVILSRFGMARDALTKADPHLPLTKTDGGDR